MPGLVVSSVRNEKRKRNGENEDGRSRRKVKIRRTSSSDGSSDVVASLEEEIKLSPKHYNNIAKLLEAARSKTDQSEIATISLCRVFCRLLADGKLSRSHTTSRDEGTIVAWLRARFEEYAAILRACIQHDRPQKSKLGLTLSMQIVKGELSTETTAFDAVWRSGTFARVVRAVMSAEASDESFEEFIGGYMQVYDDVRYYTLSYIPGILDGETSTNQSVNSTQRALSLLASLPPSPDATSTEDKSFHKGTKSSGKRQEPVHKNVTSCQKQAQRAWLSALSKALSIAQRKFVLQILVDAIVPWFADPIHLMDFLTDSFNEGGAIALLALSGMFSLITTRNLDYPSFYPKLYSLLDSDVLHSTRRSRFLRLLNEFLGSSHLPAALVASFIKRLSRLALHAPPAAIVAVYPLVYNLFQAHPTCTFMMHRQLRTDAERHLIGLEGAEDPFDMEEPDPMLTGATESCVWELVSLQGHYHPNIASLANIISHQFTRKSYNLEDFLDHSYHGLVSAELGQDLKKAPVVEFEIPKQVFTTQDGDATLSTLMSQIMSVPGDSPAVDTT